MPFIKYIIWCVLFFNLSLIVKAQQETPAQLMQTVKSSLVEVRTENTKTFDDGQGHLRTATYHTQGSGVIIDPNGLIVTNTHIVANAPRIFVGLSDGTIMEARIVHSSDADFSFIKIDPPQSLNAIRWADSSLAQSGTPVIALTNADDGQHILGGTITSLINSALTNTIEAFELNLDLVHGDSGGPVLDDQGNLLGLIMGKQNSEGGEWLDNFEW